MPDNTTDSAKKRTYDAIVIGSGASGGWAAKEFCDKGLKTLVLERGREVKHIKDYPAASKPPWDFEHRGTVTLEKRKNHHNAVFLREETLNWALPDDEQPYIQEKPFRWVRGYHMGGKSLLWARQTQRWSDFDFEGVRLDSNSFVSETIAITAGFLSLEMRVDCTVRLRQVEQLMIWILAVIAVVAWMMVWSGRHVRAYPVEPVPVGES